MKLTKLTKALLFSMLCIMMCACSDDDEPKINNAEKELIATSWQGYMINYVDGNVYRHPVIMQFLYPTEGIYVQFDDEGNPSDASRMSYKFERNVVSFGGAVTGDWTITKLTKKHLVLEAFEPFKSVYELERIM